MDGGREEEGAWYGVGGSRRGVGWEGNSDRRRMRAGTGLIVEDYTVEEVTTMEHQDVCSEEAEVYFIF